ncbi:MAG: ribosome recycling factor [Clostridiaceae bacterium]|nr:ribosome recycling factor [Clostridiaceae bacterium]
MSKECEVYTGKMAKTIEVLKSDFATVRAGRANPSVLDKITVEHYGSTMLINQLASVSVPEPRVLAIQPWDASATKAIEKAIQTSDLGINPQSDGKIIRLTFPQLTEERRKDLTKTVKKMGEDAKVAVRNIRRDAVDTFKNQKKKSEITEDDLKTLEKEIQDSTDKFCKDIDVETAKKEKELMEL